MLSLRTIDRIRSMKECNIFTSVHHSVQLGMGKIRQSDEAWTGDVLRVRWSIFHGGWVARGQRWVGQMGLLQTMGQLTPLTLPLGHRPLDPDLTHRKVRG